MKVIYGTIVSVTITRSNLTSEFWKFEIKEVNGNLWECKSLKRYFHDPIIENGWAEVSFLLNKEATNAEILRVLIKIPAIEVPTALSDETIFENKSVEVTYNEKALASGYLRNIEKTNVI